MHYISQLNNKTGIRNKYLLFLSLLVFLLFVLNSVVFILLSYLQSGISLAAYAFLDVSIYLFNTVVVFLITCGCGWNIWKNRGKSFSKLILDISCLCLPLLVSFLCIQANYYYSKEGEKPWETKIIFWLHKSWYEQDALKFYRENIGKVNMWSDYHEERKMPLGFPAYDTQYNIHMNQDSTYTLMAHYTVYPLLVGGGFLYYSGDSTLVQDNRFPGLHYESFYPLDNKWYYWYNSFIL